jgi:hypothetical protein
MVEAPDDWRGLPSPRPVRRVSVGYGRVDRRGRTERSYGSYTSVPEIGPPTERRERQADPSGVAVAAAVHLTVLASAEASRVSCFAERQKLG